MKKIFKSQISIFMVLVLAISTLVLSGCSRKPKGAGDDTALSEGYTEEEENITSSTEYGVVSGNYEAKKAFVIWTYNEELKIILDKVYKTGHEKNYKRIVVVNINDEDSYGNKLNTALLDPKSDFYPDMIVFNTDNAKKYVDDERIIPLSKSYVSDTDLVKSFEYLKSIGTDSKGQEKIAFFQANPGSIQIRADLCAKYLKTTEPAELQERYFSSWNKIKETADTVYKASNRKCKLFAGYEDLLEIACGSKKATWLDENNSLVEDSAFKGFESAVLGMLDSKTIYKTETYSDEWKSLMEGNGTTTDAAMCYVGNPIFTKWLLPEGTFKNNTILVPGPEYFYMNSQGLAVTEKCSDKKFAGKLIKALTVDEDEGQKIYDYNYTFVNNTSVIDNILVNKSSSYNENIYSESNENYIKLYSRIADHIATPNTGVMDKEIKGLYRNLLNQYADKKIASRDEFKSNFKSDVASMLSRMNS
ncbi:MAG: hypothetical protein K6D02_03825 [Lachnospiraceae bacterium]|nr:hypothetical protein [Lachnospiraceae bacterium]